MSDETKKREPGCKCHREEGDSECPVHDEAPKYVLRHMKCDDGRTWCGATIPPAECWEHGDELKFCPTCYGALSAECFRRRQACEKCQGRGIVQAHAITAPFSVTNNGACCACNGTGLSAS